MKGLGGQSLFVYSWHLLVPLLTCVADVYFLLPSIGAFQQDPVSLSIDNLVTKYTSKIEVLLKLELLLDFGCCSFTGRCVH